jgi:hypothetical protein
VESVEPGGTSVSHVLINNGSHTEQYLDIGITTDELPPGSIGFAVAIIALQLPILALARVIIDYRFLQGGIDMPALVVSLISSLPLISGVFFARTELSQSPLLSRATVFGGAVLGNLYALWLTIAASEPRNGGVGRLTSLVDWLAQWADDVILLLLLLLLVRASGRMCRIAFRFAKRMRGDESQPVDLRGPGAVL